MKRPSIFRFFGPWTDEALRERQMNLLKKMSRKYPSESDVRIPGMP